MSYKYIQNKKCKYFPCHKIDNIKDFNCLFCYCPLYYLEDFCKGNYTYTKDGIKDCSNCNIPHTNYEYIINKIKEYSKKEVDS